MGETYITDITHFDGLPPRLARGPAGRLVRYLGSIVSAASVIDIGVWRDANIRCRRRPGRKPCPGHIQVYRHGHFASIDWHCSSCDDQGIISNWNGSTWDLSQSEGMLVEGAKPAELVVSEEELRELRQIFVLDKVNRSVIDGATVTPGGFVLHGSEDNFEDLLQYIGEEADRGPDLRRRKILGQVYEKIEDLLVETLDAESDLDGEEQSWLPPLTTEAENFLREVQKRLGEDPK